MKNKFTLFPSLLLLLSYSISSAQSFSVLEDTFYLTSTPYVSLHADSVITIDQPVTFSWQVRACNFPPDWVDSNDFAICDNSYCRYLSSIWPSVRPDSTFQYAASDTSVLSLMMNVPDFATPGCYYLTMRLRNNHSDTDNVATETWFICHNATLSVPKNSVASAYLLYPNPAWDELHLRCSPNAGIEQVEVYNTLGQRLKTVACTNGAATIMLYDLSAGVYIARLVDSNGVSAAMKKFIKD